MKYTCHFLIGILLLLTWNACERRLDIRLDSAAGIPVFYGVLTPDQNPRFQLFETIGALDSAAFPVIKNASVMLIENGVDTTRFSYDPSGYYLTDTAWRPLVGNRYSLSITIPGSDSVLRAPDVIVPPVPQIIAMSFEDSVKQRANGASPQGLLQITLEPELSTVGYFQLEVMNKAGLEQEDIYIFSDDISQQFAVVCEAYRNLFSDRCFPTTHTWRWNFETILYLPGSGTLPAEQLSVRLSRLSESHFRYLESRQNQIADFGALFIRADNVYSNIEGGLGFFGASNATTTIIPL